MNLMTSYHELNTLAMQTTQEIAALTAKNQNAPKYMYTQLNDLRGRMFTIAAQIDAEMLSITRGKV